MNARQLCVWMLLGTGAVLAFGEGGDFDVPALLLSCSLCYSIGRFHGRRSAARQALKIWTIYESSVGRSSRPGSVAVVKPLSGASSAVLNTPGPPQDRAPAWENAIASEMVR